MSHKCDSSSIFSIAGFCVVVAAAAAAAAPVMIKMIRMSASGKIVAQGKTSEADIANSIWFC